ncbi:MBL fold metallo-hydrolase [Kitasatospora sp. NBC_01287]|uniref:ComEC/Rec2 family competence protein n=1 Tax=Kitasatospora sp. NBC_01287 TaxID=2903573 RepID=UPI00225870AB|nr:MBL fold metallo-hydrolase [Kitasatospora sp. NBC_01287]MCX4748149.1 MBL fold metallo-hydrolase [Kitasatospora sp. NBC_01287]
MSDNLTQVSGHVPDGDTASLGITILDVGHGNSAVVHDGDLCAVIDAGRSGTVPQAELERRKVSRMVHLVLSHGDEDHIGGSPALLLDDAFTIGTVWMNPDWRKDTAIWKRLQMAVMMRKRRGGLDGHQMITTETGQVLRCGRARLEVLHPDITMVLGGSTSQPSQHGSLTSNSTSVVIRVHLDGQPVALLAADVDAAGLAHIVDSKQELSASVLVFPHHGGLPGSSRAPREFARNLTQLVSPDLVVFSIGGGLRPRNPHPEIVAGVREAAPEAHIACTQLSAHCHDKDQQVAAHHLAQRPAAGRGGGRCCAGTISVTADAGELSFDPPLKNHRDFVTASVDSAQCRVPLPLPRQRSAARAVTQPKPSKTPKA